MRLAAVTVGHSSSSILGGKGWDAATVASLSPVLGAGTIVSTNGLDTQAALRASGVKRPFLVLPPWFNDDTVAAGLRYYADHGLTTAGHIATTPAASGATSRRPTWSARGWGSSRKSSRSTRRSGQPARPTADGVLIAGTGFRCVAILEVLEQDLKRPVISANQASLWHCLRSAGVHTPVGGYGSLLRL